MATANPAAVLPYLSAAQAAAVADGVEPGAASTAVILGDSVIANGLLTSLGAGYGYGANTRAIVHHLNRFLGNPWVILNEVGYSGYTIAQIAANWTTQVTPYLPAGGTLFFEGGINNFNTTYNQTAAQAFAEIKSVWQMAVAAGVRLVYFMSGLTYTSPYAANRAQYLAMCRQFAREHRSFEFIDAATSGLSFNQTGANLALGVPLSGYLASDNVHPTAKYAIVIAQAMQQHFVRRGYPDVPIFSPYSNDGAGNGDTTNIFVNSLVGSDAISGSKWTTSVQPSGARAPTASIVSMGTTGMQSNLPGQLLQVVWAPGTAPADSDFMNTGQVLDMASGAIAAGIAGNTYKFRMYMKATATGGVIHGLNLQSLAYSWNYAATYAQMVEGVCFDTGAGLSVHGLECSSYEGVFESQPFTYPAGVDAFHFVFYAIVQAAPGATVTLQCGAPECRLVFNI